MSLYQKQELLISLSSEAAALLSRPPPRPGDEIRNQQLAFKIGARRKCTWNLGAMIDGDLVARRRSRVGSRRRECTASPEKEKEEREGGGDREARGGEI